MPQDKRSLVIQIGLRLDTMSPRKRLISEREQMEARAEKRKPNSAGKLSLRSRPKCFQFFFTRKEGGEILWVRFF
jgi:hypothetical protein